MHEYCYLLWVALERNNIFFIQSQNWSPLTIKLTSHCTSWLICCSELLDLETIRLKMGTNQIYAQHKHWIFHIWGGIIGEGLSFTKISKNMNWNFTELNTRVKNTQMKNKNWTSRILNREFASSLVVRIPHVHITGHSLDFWTGGFHRHMAQSRKKIPEKNAIK